MSNASDFIIENGVLTKYVGPGGDVIIPEGVTSIGRDVFAWPHDAVISITVPDGVKEIGCSAFASCCKLKKVYLPDSVEKIGSCAFNHDINLTTIQIPDKLASNMKISDVKELFGRKPNGRDGRLDEIILATLRGDASLSNGLNNLITTWLMTKKTRSEWAERLIREDNANLLHSLLMMKNKLALDEIDEYIEIATKEQKTEALACLMNYKNVKFLSKEVLEKRERQVEKELGLKERSVADWRKIFKFTISDGSVHITAYKGNDSVVTIPSHIGKNTVTGFALTEISNHRFKNLQFTEIITAVQIENGICEFGDHALHKCSRITELVIPDSVTAVGIDACRACVSLKSVTLPPYLKAIGYGMFSECSSLEEIKIPNKVESIKDYAFSWCTALSNVTIPESIKIIGKSAFCDCRSLKKLRIPRNVESIGDGAFRGCTELTIYASAGSYAETYAKENNIPFVAE